MQLFFLLFFLMSHVHAAIDIPWDPDSDPAIMSSFFEKDFDELPLDGEVIDKKKYWSGDYWALKNGNINYRWYAKDKIGFNHRSPDLNKLRKMTMLELAELSPSEKYDLFTGRYDYPLRNEVSKIANANAAFWEGICHGWSPATMNHDEPTPKLMINPDGVEIPFGSSDIKALLSYYYAFQHRAPDTHQMGKRCFSGSLRNNERDCNEDLNAGAFHIVIANRLGYDGKGVIADIQRLDQVWNHPIAGFKTTVLRELRPDAFSAPGTVKRIEVKTTLKYVDENGHDWHAVIGTKKQSYESITYQYLLDVDVNNVITGGNWISSERPDFLWLMPRPRRFEGILSRLGELLNE